MADQAARDEVIDSDGTSSSPTRCGASTPNPSSVISSTARRRYVQATGITARVPDMAAAFLTAMAQATTTGRQSPRTPTGRRSRSTRWPARRLRPGGAPRRHGRRGHRRRGALPDTPMLTWVEEADIFGGGVPRLQQLVARVLLGRADRLYRRRRSSRCRIRTAAIARCGGASTSSGVKAVMIRPGAVHRRARSSTIPRTTRSGRRPPSSAARSACTRPRTPTCRTSCRLLGLADGVGQPDRGARAAPGPHQRARPQMAVG